MGNNKQFNNIFNECLEHLLTGQETIEQCLQRYPEYATELEPLLRTVVLCKGWLMLNHLPNSAPEHDIRCNRKWRNQRPRNALPDLCHGGRSQFVLPCWFLYLAAALYWRLKVMPGNLLYAVKLTTENFR